MLFVLLGTPAIAGTINVPADQSTIQEGINAAVDGDTVLVAPGTYPENINFIGKKILVTSHFALNQDTSFVRTTVIDGSTPSNTDSASCVLMISGEDSTSVLQGFTLTGGTGTRWIDEHGAGTYFEGGGILTALTSPTIRNNIIVGNEAVRAPGGVASAGGGGIRCGDGSPLIINNIITGNSGLYGGGIVMNYASGIIKNNIITNNLAYKSGLTPSYGGGGVWINGAGTTTIVENNVIVGNSATGNGGQAGLGGGILNWQTPMTARNNIVWGNTQRTGGPIYIINSTSTTVTYCDVEGGHEGEGNIDLEPQFETGNYLLADGSPCIDAGDTSAVYNDPEDPGNPGSAQYPSKGTLRNDMGAYGGPGRALLGSMPTAVEENTPKVKVPKALGLDQNFPNPFNPSTTIKYELSEDTEVQLKVYTIRGKEVSTLVDGAQGAGAHSAHWNGRDDHGRKLSSGVYLYRLQVGENIVTKKMMLVK
jgi:hypothetical protein